MAERYRGEKDDLIASIQERMDQLGALIPHVHRLTRDQLWGLDDALGAAYGRGFTDGQRAPGSR